ncbi:hypothetical protein [Pontibacillus halophilus]|uniref:hypothetical protein n=1 Tax=Pontibacillus halophilus TaxID=516704 RepID=UPI00040E1963|nr:hypothetical protein [Pontibacillus halophilus]
MTGKRKNSRSPDMLLRITKPHIQHVTTVKEWDEYARANDLPTSRILGHTFGSWNEFKESLGIPAKSREGSPNKVYDQKKLINIIKEHSDFFTSKSVWNEYARKNQLPVYEVFYYHKFKWKDIQEIAGVPYSAYTDEELLQLANEYKEYLTSREEWDEFAKENGYPKSVTFHRRFGGWFKFKKRLFGRTKEDLLKIAREHEHAFTTKKEWDEYSQAHHLPKSQEYYRTFGNWNKVKSLIHT